MKTNVLLTAVMIVVAGLVSCTKSDRANYQPVNGHVIHIGALLPLTGTGASAGSGTQAALELAVQDITDYLLDNRTGITLVLHVADTKTDTSAALNQLKSFFTQGIRLVIGPYSSSELAHVKPFADANDMLIVSPSSVAVSLAIPHDNIFRFVSSDLLQGKAMSKLLSEDKIRVIIPMIRNDLWGNDLLEATSSDFLKMGGTVQTVVRYTPGTTDFTEAMQLLENEVEFALLHHNPNEVAVYLLSFDEGTSILASSKQFAALNNVYWYGGSAYALNSTLIRDTSATLFAYTHGLPCPVFGLDDAAKYRWQPLNDRIREKTGNTPDVYAITAYDALWVLMKTSRMAGGNPSIECLKSIFVEESRDYFGASGNTLLDENGDRAIGNYDFWAIKSDSTGYFWKRVARYNSANGNLTRLTK